MTPRYDTSRIVKTRSSISSVSERQIVPGITDLPVVQATPTGSSELHHREINPSALSATRDLPIEGNWSVTWLVESGNTTKKFVFEKNAAGVFSLLEGEWILTEFHPVFP